MLNAVQKIGEFGGIEIGFEVQLDLIVLGERKGTLEDFDNGLFFVLAVDLGVVDEGQDDACCADTPGEGDEGVQMMLAAFALGG